MREREWSSRLTLNGETMRLGTAGDVIDRVHGRREFDMSVTYGDSVYSWTFVGECRKRAVMDVERVGVDGVEDTSGRLRSLLPISQSECDMAQCLRRLTYLSADRLGPSKEHPLVNPHEGQVIGSRGENAVSVLYANRNSSLSDGLAMTGAQATLLSQVQERMARFFPGYGMVVEKSPGANAATLRIRASTNTGFHLPVHAGFGFNQVLPIVVAASSAESGDLLLIENPEAHLHPAGQSAMGGFLATVASVGVQLVIETHSDHLLNGMRRAVQVEDLSHEDVAIYFFRRREEIGDSGSQVASPTLDVNGYLDDWPTGFFDQTDRDLSLLLGWSV